MCCYITKNPLHHIGSEGLWWRHCFQIRTVGSLDIFQGNGFGAAFEVVGDDEPVIKQVQGVDEGIYDTFWYSRLFTSPYLNCPIQLTICSLVYFGF